MRAVLGDAPVIDPAEAHRTVLRVIQPRDERGQRRLADPEGPTRASILPGSPVRLTSRITGVASPSSSLTRAPESAASELVSESSETSEARG